MKVELREITDSHLMRDSPVMISSTMPSAKYSCSGSPLMFWNGSTAIDGLSEVASSANPVGSSWPPVVGEFNPISRYPRPATVTRCAWPFFPDRALFEAPRCGPECCFPERPRLARRRVISSSLLTISPSAFARTQRTSSARVPSLHRNAVAYQLALAEIEPKAAKCDFVGIHHTRALGGHKFRTIKFLNDRPETTGSLAYRIGLENPRLGEFNTPCAVRPSVLRPGES